MSIRVARPSDIPEIVALGSMSLKEGPYKDEIDNPEQSALFAKQVMDNPKGRVLVDVEGDKIVGILAFVIYPHYFTAKLTAIELMWYFLKEYRIGLRAIELLRYAEKMARELGATKFQFTSPTDAVGKAYERLGYKALETAYQKGL